MNKPAHFKFAELVSQDSFDEECPNKPSPLKVVLVNDHFKISTESSLSLVYLDDSPNKEHEFHMMLEQTMHDKDLEQLTIEVQQS